MKSWIVEINFSSILYDWKNMIKYENQCVDCGLPCLGDLCPNRNVKIYECDCCNQEVEQGDLYSWEGYEYCCECIKRDLDVID